MYLTDAYVEFSRTEKKNNFSANTNKEAEEPTCYRPEYIEKDEFLIFHPVTQNFRLRKVKMSDKDTCISHEITGSKYNKQSDDNQIFSSPKVAVNHAKILNIKNGLKSQFFLENLGDNVTIVNGMKLEIPFERSSLLKSGDLIQFGKEHYDVNRMKMVPPIKARLEIIQKQFRPVVIDGCNVCHGFRHDPKQFHVDGLDSVYDCFKKLGYEDRQIHIIMKPPPQHVKTSNYDSVIGKSNY